MDKKNEIKNKKGFTLAELLIVVAIIAVLVAISIPIFSSQLEKAREAVDLSNVRSAYAQIKSAVITGDHSDSSYNSLQQIYQIKVSLKQQKSGWDTKGVLDIGGITSEDSYYWQGSPQPNGTCTIYYDEQQEQVTINWNGYTLIPSLQWKIVDGKVQQAPYSEVSGNWVCNALSDMIVTTSKEGQSLNVKGINNTTSPNMKKALSEGYTFEVGVFLTDSSGKIIVDTGGITINSSDTKISVYPKDYAEKNKSNGSGKAYEYGSDYEDNSDLKIAVQFFKVKQGRSGSVALSTEEAQEFENLLSFNELKE